MPSSKKGRKKGSQVPAADALSSPAPPRRNDAGLPFEDHVLRPPSSPSKVDSPAGSKGPRDLKIDEVSNGSTTFELTSASRDLHGSNIS